MQRVTASSYCLTHAAGGASRLVGCAALLSVLGPGAAWAGQDVRLSLLGSFNGSSVSDTDAKAAFDVVVNQLGVAVANKPIAPGETLGLNGFDIGVNSTIAFIDSRDASAGSPSPWARVTDPDDVPGILWIPGIQVRKGLPLSLEVGVNAGYVAFTKQTTFGGYGRWGLVEGYWPLPDVSVQVGYAGYIGNDELELGAMDASVTAGYSLPFGTLVGINQAQFCPYVGLGTIKIDAAPRFAGTENPFVGATAVSGFKSSEFYDANFSDFALHGGFRIVSGDFQLRVAASVSPGHLITLNGGLGFVF
jgi:hypothetical protein